MAIRGKNKEDLKGRKGGMGCWENAGDGLQEITGTYQYSQWARIYTRVATVPGFSVFRSFSLFPC